MGKGVCSRASAKPPSILRRLPGNRAMSPLPFGNSRRRGDFMAYTIYRHVITEGAMSPPTAAEIAAIETHSESGCPGFQGVPPGREWGAHRVRGQRATIPRGWSNWHSRRRIDRPGATWRPFWALEAARRAWSLPREDLPIACDGGGSMLFLDLTPKALVASSPSCTAGRHGLAGAERCVRRSRTDVLRLHQQVIHIGGLRRGVDQ